MKHVSEYPWPDDPSIPWTVIGKGPTFQELIDCSPPGYRIGCNDVVSRARLNILLCNDVEGLTWASPYIRNTQAIFLPEYLIIPGGTNFNRGTVRTYDRTDLPIPQNRLDDVYYFTSAKSPEEMMRLADYDISCRWSSGEAAFKLICRFARCERVIECGLDGGKAYHPEFQMFYRGDAETGCQKHGSFDKQRPELLEWAKSHGKEVVKWGQ